MFSFLVPFINRLLRSLDKKAFQTLLALVFFFWSVIPTLSFRQIDFSRLDFFIVFYMIGVYIRRYVHGQVHYRNLWNLAVGLCSAAVLLLSVAAFDALGKITGSAFFLDNACYFRDYNMIPTVICTVSLFLFFSNLDFSCRPIELAAGSMLHVLIIHMNGYLRQWVWEVVYPNNAYAA